MTKFVDVTVTFNNGSSVINKVEVNKGKYASLQSKASTKRTNLIARVALGKMTQEDASKDWVENVRTPWINMVSDPLKASYPEEVRNLITDIRPVTTGLDLEIPAQDVQ